MEYYVYILECVDGTYYIGTTFDPEIRCRQHNDGLGSTYTISRRPVKLVYVEQHDCQKAAVFRERQLKKWSRNKKAALIARNYDELHRLSRRRKR